MNFSFFVFVHFQEMKVVGFSRFGKLFCIIPWIDRETNYAKSHFLEHLPKSNPMLIQVMYVSY